MSRKLPWGTLLTLSPVILALIVFQLLSPFVIISQEHYSAIGSALSEQVFPRSLFLFMALQIAHFFMCAVAVFWSLQFVLAHHKDAFRGYLIFALALSAFVFVAIFVLSPMGLAAYSFTHDFYIDFYASTEIGERWLTPVFLKLTTLDLAVLAPTWFGIVAVVFVAAASNLDNHTHGIFDPFDIQSEAGSKLSRANRLLVYLLAGVLCTSSITATMYFHLPSVLLHQAITPPTDMFSDWDPAAMKTLLANLRQFEADLSVFWSLIFTMTLITAVWRPIYQDFLRLPMQRDPSTGLYRQSVGAAGAVLTRASLYLSPLLAGIVGKAVSIPGLIA